MRVWTWIEEFALGGHAVALVGAEQICDTLDNDGHYLQRLTRGWRSSEVLVDEPGCGVTFQPYDTVDMMSTVVMAMRLVTDVLLGKVPESTARMWLGDRDAVARRGGEPTGAFIRSYCEVSEVLRR